MKMEAGIKPGPQFNLGDNMKLTKAELKQLKRLLDLMEIEFNSFGLCMKHETELLRKAIKRIEKRGAK